MSRETREALAICRTASAALVVNDYWRVAIDEGAPWVHLGQSDLDDADVGAIRKARVKLGVSTHDEAELERALKLEPDYVALGPIYFTRLKAMAFAPQGLERIGDMEATHWRDLARRHRRTDCRAGEAVPRGRR